MFVAFSVWWAGRLGFGGAREALPGARAIEDDSSCARGRGHGAPKASSAEIVRRIYASFHAFTRRAFVCPCLSLCLTEIDP